MKRLAIIAATTATAALAAPAFAGSMSQPAPEPIVSPPPAPIAPVSYDWTGFYAGGQLGFGQLSSDDGAAEDDGNGVIGGVHAGYDWDFGDFVVGAGVDYDAADIEMDGGTGSLDSVARAKVRAGVDSGNWLFYGTGGAAWGEAELAAFPGAERDVGWFAGAGAEYRVNENISVAGEALYHQFDDYDDTGVDLNATTFQARMSYRF